MTQADIGGRAIATLCYSDIRHAGPVFHGDTLYADSMIVEAEELPGGGGALTVETRATNQRSELVLTLRRKIVLPARPAGEPPGEKACKR
jgi:itaconyl-CoA hydratase